MKNFDNKTRCLGDDLKSELHKGNKIRIAADSYYICTYETLKNDYIKPMKCSSNSQVVGNFELIYFLVLRET